MNLPRVVHFPFGYTVAVKQVSDAEMKAENDGEGVDGLWDCETRTIYILRSLSVRRKRYILGHEMIHALADWQHDMLNDEAMRP